MAEVESWILGVAGNLRAVSILISAHPNPRCRAPGRQRFGAARSTLGLRLPLSTPLRYVWWTSAKCASSSCEKSRSRLAFWRLSPIRLRTSMGAWTDLGYLWPVWTLRVHNRRFRPLWRRGQCGATISAATADTDNAAGHPSCRPYDGRKRGTSTRTRPGAAWRR